MNPVLVPCRACGGSVSVDASACPRCGQPVIGKPSGAVKVVVMVFGVALLVFVLYESGFLPRL
jgi:hypothetical protein